MTDLNPRNWTCGAEHEFGDWSRSRPLPPGYKVDEDDFTVMNSDGTAADPKGKDNSIGGEINTPPYTGVQELADGLRELIDWDPRVSVNHRSNLHVHWRVPGLSEDLPLLKQLAAYNYRYLKEALELVEPIPKPTGAEYPDPIQHMGAMRRWRRRKVSHHTVLVAERLRRQMAALTVQEFHEAEVPRSREGKPMWHAQPRAAVNVRQLLETDTIEFRHFPGTLVPAQLAMCARWCREYLVDALGPQMGPGSVFFSHPLEFHRPCTFPVFPNYVHRLEVRYRATCFDGSVPRRLAAENVKAIQAGTWDPSPEDLRRAL